jgi:hypothetical protein
MLAGPLFTSVDYPIPSTEKGMMLPVAQLSLVEISSLSGQDFGDGLLQLWCDPDWDSSSRGFVRVVPRADLDSQTITPFDYEPHPGASSSPLPIEHIFDPSAIDIDVITGYESVGLQCQTNYFDVYCDDVPADVIESLSGDLERFQKLIDTKNQLHVLGRFYPIQYSAVDIEWNCLMHFPTWGSSGNAQIFYRLTDDGMPFSFEESLR